MERHDQDRDELGRWGEDSIYCEATCRPDDVLYVGSDDEDYESPADRRLRYEAAGQRYLDGIVPLLLTASLRGPFDAASGWTNPWRSKGRTARVFDDTRNSTSQHAQIHEDEEMVSIAETTQVETQDSLECHLPSPESLKHVPGQEQHPFMEGDELAMVQNWRSSVRPDALSVDSFWASTPQESESGRKRKAGGSQWLRKLASKRRRTEIMGSGSINTPIRQPAEARVPKQAVEESDCDASSSLSTLPSSGVPSLSQRQTSNCHNDSTELGTGHQPTHSTGEILNRDNSEGCASPGQDIQMPDQSGESDSPHLELPRHQFEATFTLSSPVSERNHPQMSSQRSPLQPKSPRLVKKRSPNKSSPPGPGAGTPTITLNLTMVQDSPATKVNSSPGFQTQRDQSFCFKMRPRAQSEEEPRLSHIRPQPAKCPGTDTPTDEDDSWSGLSSSHEVSQSNIAERLVVELPNVSRPDASRTSTESEDEDTSSCDLSSISSQEFEGFESPRRIPSDNDDVDLRGSWCNEEGGEAIACADEHTCDKPEFCEEVHLYWSVSASERMEATPVCSSETGHDDPIRNTPDRGGSEQTGQVDESRTRCRSNYSTVSSMSVKEEDGLVSTRSSQSLPSRTHTQSSTNQRPTLLTGALLLKASVRHSLSANPLPAPSPRITRSASRSAPRSTSTPTSTPASRSASLPIVRELLTPNLLIQPEDVSTASEEDASDDEPLSESDSEPGDPQVSDTALEGDQEGQDERSQQESAIDVTQKPGVSQPVSDTSSAFVTEAILPPDQEADDQDMIQGTPEEVTLGEDSSNFPPASQQSPWAPSNLSQLAQTVILRLSQGDQPATPGKRDHCSDITSTEAQTPWTKNTLSLPLLAGLHAPASRRPDQDLSTGSILHDKAVSAVQTPQQSHNHATTPSVAPRPSTPEPQFSVKSFASFMSPSPERRPRQLHRASWRGSGSRLPSTQGILASATRNPWALSQSRRVSWAPLPNEGDNVPDNHLQTPSQTKSRPTSPPPLTPIADLPTSKESKFHHHFSAIARRNNSLRQQLLPPESQRTLGSPETQAMAEKFLAVDEAMREPVEGSQEAGEAQALPPPKPTKAPEGPGDIVEDVFREMSDYLETWNVDAELEQARKGTGFQAPRVDSTVQSPWSG